MSHVIAQAEDEYSHQNDHVFGEENELAYEKDKLSGDFKHPQKHPSAVKEKVNRYLKPKELKDDN